MDDKKKLKILLLEDNPDDVLLIEYMLQKENLLFTSQRVDTRDEFNDAIRSFKPDVVLSDHGLPGFNSREALRICLKEAPATPFILVTGTVSDEYAVSCLHEGADDYILKSNLTRLPSAIVSAVKKRRIEKLKRKARLELKRQNAELIKVNKELDSFVYSVSHNLRGPLASVMGLLRLTKDQDDLKVLDSLHMMMESSISKLDETLREILEYSRNARNEIQSVEIDWSSIIQSSLQKLDYLDKDNRVMKSISLQTDIPFYSDATRIHTIFSNLLSNAITYSEQNRESVVNIEVYTTGTTASFKVHDNGIGIREDILPKVFNMFYRGSEKSQGAGLGLYIVKETLTKLKGNIEIASIYGKGTTVQVNIPAASL
ncbi:MAG TPA: hybrid sensor histidine kinase/response regulator [Ohtaekwangia sp.]|uniref:ATP-binding response regulator n=1 Tax=Ohtaekwangia sp. TaxID=2066019 RepID=UPI002F930F1B